MKIKKRYVSLLLLCLLLVMYYTSYIPYDQLLSERYALAKCYIDVAEKSIVSIEECSIYARSHIDLYPEFISSNSSQSACLASKGVLNYIKNKYPFQLELRDRSRQVVDKYCHNLVL